MQSKHKDTKTTKKKPGIVIRENLMDTRPPKPDPGTLQSLGPGELYRKVLEPIWQKVSIYDGPATFLKQFADVGKEQGLLLAAHWCASEVCNGGFHQFFSNPTGVLAPEAIRGYEMIGTSKAAELTRAAAALLGDPYPRDHERRILALQSIEREGEKREEWDPFFNLDNKYFEWEGSQRFYTMADDFVRRNLKACFK